jgi:hypothetical protein
VKGKFGIVDIIEEMITKRVKVSATKAVRCVWKREERDVKFTS